MKRVSYFQVPKVFIQSGVRTFGNNQHYKAQVRPASSYAAYSPLPGLYQITVRRRAAANRQLYDIMANLTTTILSFLFMTSNFIIEGHKIKFKNDIKTDSTEIPFSFGLYNTYVNGDEFITVKNEDDSVVFKQSGKWKNRGSVPQNPLTEKGKYTILIKLYKGTAIFKELKEQFEVNGNERALDLTIAIMDSSGTDNVITVNKYYGNELNIKLNRIWNPQQQFEMDSSLLPDYTVINTSDSILYGIFHRLSSSMTIGWIQLHYIGYLDFQEYKDKKWVDIECNAPRIEMNLKPTETGNTLKDMKLDCDKSNFHKNGFYRIVFEYGINNTIVRESTGGVTYIEPHIYQIYDEFQLK